MESPKRFALPGGSEPVDSVQQRSHLALHWAAPVSIHMPTKLPVVEEARQVLGHEAASDGTLPGYGLTDRTMSFPCALATKANKQHHLL